MELNNLQSAYDRAWNVLGEDAFGAKRSNSPHVASMIDRQGRYMELGWIPPSEIRHIPATSASSSRLALTIIPLGARNQFDRFQYLQVGMALLIARANDAGWMEPRPFKQLRVREEAPTFRTVPSDDFGFCLQRHLIGATVLSKATGIEALDNLCQHSGDPDWLVEYQAYLLSAVEDPDRVVGRFTGLPDFTDGYTTASFRFDFWRS